MQHKRIILIAILTFCLFIIAGVRLRHTQHQDKALEELRIDLLQCNAQKSKLELELKLQTYESPSKDVIVDLQEKVADALSIKANR